MVSSRGSRNTSTAARSRKPVARKRWKTRPPAEATLVRRRGEPMATDEQLDDLSFNPFDASQTRTSWEKLARLRRECPVSEQFEGFFYTAKYDDTQAAFRDNERFWLGEAGMRRPGSVVPFEERFLGEIDPPDHVRLRRLIGRHFTPVKSMAAEPFARSYIRQRLETIAQAGTAELVRDFSTTVPIAITAHVLGLPTDNFDEIVRDM